MLGANRLVGINHRTAAAIRKDRVVARNERCEWITCIILDSIQSGWGIHIPEDDHVGRPLQICNCPRVARRIRLLR